MNLIGYRNRLRKLEARSKRPKLARMVFGIYDVPVDEAIGAASLDHICCVERRPEETVPEMIGRITDIVATGTSVYLIYDDTIQDDEGRDILR